MGRKRRPLSERPPKDDSQPRSRATPAAIEPTRLYRLRELPAVMQIGGQAIAAEIDSGRLRPFIKSKKQLFLGEEVLRWAREAQQEACNGNQSQGDSLTDNKEGRAA